jgi:hypothetical protein
MTQWFSVTDDLPPQDTLCLAYSEPWGAYALAKWNPAVGWTSAEDRRVNVVTHWCDLAIPLPYEIRNKLDPELAKKHKIISEDDEDW